MWNLLILKMCKGRVKQPQSLILSENFSATDSIKGKKTVFLVGKCVWQRTVLTFREIFVRGGPGGGGKKVSGTVQMSGDARTTSLRSPGRALSFCQ